MPVSVAIEQFGRTFANSLRSITACIAAVVEEETQQIQIVIADVPPQEEVVPQAAIEVLYQRTGARYIGHRLDCGSFDPMVLHQWGKASAERLSQAGFSVEWHDYPMQHAVCAEEIDDIRSWLLGVFERS